MFFKKISVILSILAVLIFSTGCATNYADSGGGNITQRNHWELHVNMPIRINFSGQPVGFVGGGFCPHGFEGGCQQCQPPRPRQILGGGPTQPRGWGRAPVGQKQFYWSNGQPVGSVGTPGFY